MAHRACYLALVWALFASCLSGAEPELSGLERQLERAMRAAHGQAVADIEGALAGYRRRLDPAWRDMPRRLGRQLRELRRTSWAVPCLRARGMEEGDIGRLPGGLPLGEWWRVVQVVGPQTMLIENFSDGWQNPHNYEWIPSPDAPLYVYGVDTSDLVDGEAVKLAALFICRGTETYQTILGPRTVYRVEPFAIADPSELLEKLERRGRSARKSAPQVVAE